MYLFCCFMVVFPPQETGTKQQQSAGVGGMGLLSYLVLHTRVGHRHRQVTAHEQLQGGSDTASPTALTFVISAGNYRKSFSYLCLCKSILSWPTEIICEAQGGLALPERCGVFLWSKVRPGAYKPHCWFFIYL